MDSRQPSHKRENAPTKELQVSRVVRGPSASRRSRSGPFPSTAATRAVYSVRHCLWRSFVGGYWPTAWGVKQARVTGKYK